MRIIYSFQCSPSKCCEAHDETYYDTEDFELEVDKKEILDLCAKFIADDYIDKKSNLWKEQSKEQKYIIQNITENVIKSLIKEFDIEVEDIYYDAIKENFEERAKECYYDR